MKDSVLGSTGFIGLHQTILNWFISLQDSFQQLQLFNTALRRFIAKIIRFRQSRASLILVSYLGSNLRCEQFYTI